MLTRYKQHFRAGSEAMAKPFARIGFTPNGMTLLGLVLSWSVCALYIWNHNAVMFGVLMIFCGLFDLLDGALARLTNKTSKFGAYLDALSDRVFEASGLFAVAWVTGYWALAYLLILGALLVSYAKARAAMEVKIINNEWPDFMERTERDVIFALGMILWGSSPEARIAGLNLILCTFVLLLVLVYGTLIQRLLRARHIIQKRPS